MKRILSLALCALMIICSLLFAVSCGNGEGETVTFTLEVEHLDGTRRTFSVTTSESNVADALVNEGYVSGDMDTYGLYIKTVDGETLDYSRDNAYWAFYVDGEYAQAGVSFTQPENGATYLLKAESASW